MSAFVLDVALEWYLRRGLLIFRCQKKKPLTEHGFKDASKDRAQIMAWWEKFPAAQQIGVATGEVNQLLVVDVDRHPTRVRDLAGGARRDRSEKQNYTHR